MITSPLMRAQRFERAQEWTEQLQGEQRELNERQTSLHAQLQRLNAAWEQVSSPSIEPRAAGLPLEALEELYRELSYLARWSSQIQERIVGLH